MRLLLVEDDLTLGDLVRRRLRAENMVVDWVLNIEDAQSACVDFAYDLVVLDRGLPDGDGLSAADVLRGSRGRPRILVLTARSAVGARIEGLDAGADDYLGKPFDPNELAARCRALGRRADGGQDDVVAIANLSMDRGRRTIAVEGRGVVLPRRELLILESLVRSRGRVVTRERIVDHAYGIDDDLGSNGLEANISRLRKRLRVAGALVEIRVVRGIGYMIHAAPGRTAP